MIIGKSTLISGHVAHNPRQGSQVERGGRLWRTRQGSQDERGERCPPRGPSVDAMTHGSNHPGNDSRRKNCAANPIPTWQQQT